MQALLPAPLLPNQRSAVLTFECPQSYTTYLVELRYPTPNRGGFILGLDDFYTENLVPGAVISIARTENDGHYRVEYLAEPGQNARLLELDERRAQRYVFRPTTYACGVDERMLLTEERFGRAGRRKAARREGPPPARGGRSPPPSSGSATTARATTRPTSTTCSPASTSSARSRHASSARSSRTTTRAPSRATRKGTMPTPTSPAPPLEPAQPIERNRRGAAQATDRDAGGAAADPDPRAPTSSACPISIARGGQAPGCRAGRRCRSRRRIAAVRQMDELAEERLDLIFGRALRVALGRPVAGRPPARRCRALGRRGGRPAGPVL